MDTGTDGTPIGIHGASTKNMRRRKKNMSMAIAIS
jgi:hypothetical protein